MEIAVANVLNISDIVVKAVVMDLTDAVGAADISNITDGYMGITSDVRWSSRIPV